MAVGPHVKRIAGRAALVIALAGCNSGRDSGSPAQAAPPTATQAAKPRATDAATEPAVTCKRQPFADHIPVTEASGAAYIPAHGGHPATVMVVGDSDTNGDFVTLDPSTGTPQREGALPLDDGASDDLEGLAWRDGTLYALTSSGYMRHWRRDGDAWKLVEPAYPITKRGKGKYVCNSSHATNCGPNYEGLCLHTQPVRPPEGKRKQRDCVGFAASKQRGSLICLVMRRSGKLIVDPSRTLDVASPGVLSGCHFTPEGDLLWAAGNLFGGGIVSTVSGWRDPKTAQVRAVGRYGRGFPEAVAVGPDGQLYRFSDMMSAPSLADRYKCE